MKDEGPVASDPTPVDRSARIEKLASIYEEMTGNELDEGRKVFIAAMLADIRHWCDQHDVDFHAASDLSYSHYLEERSQAGRPLQSVTVSGGLKSISDDDICSDCLHCQYKPGDLSGCDHSWPGQQDVDGYVKACPDYSKAQSE